MPNIPQSLLDSQFVYVVTINLEGIITFASKAFQAKFGYLGHPLVGIPSLDTVCIEDHQKCRDAVEKCFEQPTKPIPVVLRKPYLNKKFISTQWEFSLQLDETGNPSEILCIGHDITHTEELAIKTNVISKMLLENQEKYSNIFELSPVGIALNTMDGQFFEVNQTFANIIGYSNDEILQLNYRVLTPQNEIATIEEHLETLKKKGVFGPFEKRCLHKDGHTISVLLHRRIFYDKSGNSYIVSIIQDISAIKEKEQIILEQNRKLKEISFTQSHIIRHPLTNILGLVMLLEREGISENAHNFVMMIRESAEQLDSLIRNVVYKSSQI
jgi:PAS domain S-box-containing protein